MDKGDRKGPGRIRGFTLIEIMVVIVIIGLIVGIVAPGIINQLGRAESQAARTQIENINQALTLFRMDHYRYPTADEGLEILLGGGQINNRPVEEYMSTIPLDPWQRPYFYEAQSQHGDDYDVYTLGADGEEGGDGADADIGTWNLKERR